MRAVMKLSLVVLTWMGITLRYLGGVSINHLELRDPAVGRFTNVTLPLPPAFSGPHDWCGPRSISVFQFHQYLDFVRPVLSDMDNRNLEDSCLWVPENSFTMDSGPRHSSEAALLQIDYTELWIDIIEKGDVFSQYYSRTNANTHIACSLTYELVFKKMHGLLSRLGTVADCTGNNAASHPWLNALSCFVSTKDPIALVSSKSSTVLALASSLTHDVASTERKVKALQVDFQKAANLGVRIVRLLNRAWEHIQTESNNDNLANGWGQFHASAEELETKVLELNRQTGHNIDTLLDRFHELHEQAVAMVPRAEGMCLSPHARFGDNTMLDEFEFS
jgi:hypothetical protein